MDITTDRTPADNSGLAKGGLTCFVETFVPKQAFVLRMNFSTKNPALRQAANRWAAPTWTCLQPIDFLILKKNGTKEVYFWYSSIVSFDLICKIEIFVYHADR
jgi:hypothetical protein